MLTSLDENKMHAIDDLEKAASLVKSAINNINVMLDPNTWGNDTQSQETKDNWEDQLEKLEKLRRKINLVKSKL